MTIEEALSGSEAPFWEVAIEEEHGSLLAMKAWHMVMLVRNTDLLRAHCGMS